MSRRITSKIFSFDKKTKIFKVDGKSVPFDTRYTLVNEKTNKGMDFFLSHSTGSEWDTNTKWVYKNFGEEFTLEIGNEDVTPIHVQNYINAKNRS